MAADSQTTISTEEGGSSKHRCEKIYRKGKKLIGIAGEGFPGLVFLDWLDSGQPAPEILIHGEADFTAIVLERVTSGGIILTEYDKWCRGERVQDFDIHGFYAIGSGRKAAAAAMFARRSAQQAVEIACKVDHCSSGPIEILRLK